MGLEWNNLIYSSPIDIFAIISAPAQERYRTAKLPDSIAKS